MRFFFYFSFKRRYLISYNSIEFFCLCLKTRIYLCKALEVSAVHMPHVTDRLGEVCRCQGESTNVKGQREDKRKCFIHQGSSGMSYINLSIRSVALQARARGWQKARSRKRHMPCTVPLALGEPYWMACRSQWEDWLTDKVVISARDFIHTTVF